MDGAVNSKTITTSLVVNRYNKIIELGSDWLVQAKLYEAESLLTTEKILNQPLAKFVSDDNTIMYLEASLSLCRLKNQVLYRPYRCDTPTHKQFMELELTPLQDGKVKMTHYLLKSEPFESPVNFIAIKFDPDQNKVIKRCSLCNRIQGIESDKWEEPEDYFKGRSDLLTIHTVCPECKNMSWKVRHSKSEH